MTVKIIQVTYRNNSIHQNNPSLGMTSEIMHASYKSLYINPDQVSKWISDDIDMFDYYGSFVMSGKVVAKRVRVWDFSKPVGSREVSSTSTNNFNNLKVQTS